MGFLIYLGVNAGLWLAGYLYRRYVQDVPDAPKPTLNVPQNTVGRPLPVVFGRCLIEEPVILWYGGAKQVPRYVPTAGGGTQLFWRASVHYGICRTNVNIDNDLGNTPRVVGFWFDRARATSSYTESFGVPRHGIGGDVPISGVGYVTYGRATETLTPSIEWVYEKAGEDLTQVPPHRGTVTLLLSGGSTYELVVAAGVGVDDGDVGFTWSQAPILARLGIEVINPCGIPLLDSVYWEIGDGDTNPACVLYNLLTMDEDGRLPFADADLDLDSFRAWAIVLWQEQNGFSRQYTDDAEIENVFNEVCKQIGGTFHEDPVTGKIKLYLVRDDYDPNLVPLLDQSKITKVVDWETVQWSKLATVVRLTYRRRKVKLPILGTNPPNYVNILAYTSGLAEWVAQPTAAANGVEPVSIDMPGVATDELAAQLVARHVRLLTVPLSRGRIQVDRSVFLAYVTQPFRLSHPDLGGGTYIVRVSAVDLGEFRSNAITLDVYQDAFHTDYAAPEEPPLSIGPTDTAPEPIRLEWIEEAPYFWQLLGELAGIGVDALVQRLWYFAENPNANQAYRGVVVQDGTPLMDTTELPYVGSFRVETEYGYENEPFDTTVGLRIEELIGWTPVAVTEDMVRERGANVLQIGGELLAFLTPVDVGGNVYRLDDVIRGIGGTKPITHGVGSPGFVVTSPFVDGGTARGNLGGMGFARTATPEAAVVGTRGGIVGEVDETSLLTIRRRAILPGTPSNLRLTVNRGILHESNASTNEPDDLLAEGVSFDARIRDRLATELSRGDDANQTPPETTLYDLLVEKDGTTTVFSAGLLTPATGRVSVSEAGWGFVQIGLRSRYVLSLGSGDVDMTSWQNPTVPLGLMEFRNLIRNGRMIDSGEAWAFTTGTPAYSDGPTQTSKRVTATGSETGLIFNQSAIVASWRPRGMSVILDFLVVQTGADSVTVLLDVLDEDSVSITTDTYGPTVVGGAGAYLREQNRIDSLSADAAILKIVVTEAVIVLPPPQAFATDFTLRLGQISADLGTNLGFESGLTGWTVDVGGYTDETTQAKVGTHRVQGQANAVNTIYQDITPAAGWHHSYFVVDYSCMHPDASLNATATLTVEARTGGGSVLESGSVTFTPTLEDKWVPLLAWCRVPAAATVVRIKLTGMRLSGSSNLLSWDDGVARLHKYLDPQWESRLTFAPTTQAAPLTAQTWGRVHADAQFPNVVLRPRDVALNAEIYETERYGKIPFRPDAVEAWEFNRTEGGGLRVRDYRVGKFRTAADFSVRILFDYRDANDDCVLLDRVVDGRGWRVSLVAGIATVELFGASATKTAALATTVQRGPRFLIVRYSASAEEVSIYGPNGDSDTTSTTGMGEIAPVSLAFDFDGGYLRVGRDADGLNTPTILVAGVDLWDKALTLAERADLWTHGGDEALPGVTGQGVVTTDSCVATVVGEDEDGVIVGYSGTGQIPHVGDGLACGRTRTPLIEVYPTPENVSADDLAESLLLGADRSHNAWQIDGDDAGVVKVATDVLDVGAAKIHLTFFVRAPVAGTYPISLADGAGNLIEDLTYVVAEADAWQRVDVDWATWAGATATAEIWLYGSFDGTSRTIHVSGPFFLDQDDDYDAPVVIPVSGSSACRVTLTGQAVPVQFVQEGEVYVRFQGQASTHAASSVVAVGDTGTSNDLRSVAIDGNALTLHHHDASGTDVASELAVMAYDTPRTVRARWNMAGLLDAPSVFAGIREETAPDDDYDRATTFTAGTTELDRLWLGNVDDADEGEVVIHEVWLRAREPVL